MAEKGEYLCVPGRPGHARGSSFASSTEMLIDKPLPSPDFRGKISITATRVSQTQRRFDWIKRVLPRGWRMTVLGGTAVAIAVLFTNIILLAWAFTRPRDPTTSYRMIFEGSCNQSSRIFTLLHLAINVLSTLLLGSSNAAMQCLSAPTRAAIDRAHNKGQWLDVGISGLRNWGYMDRWRKWCWALLLISTLPLHLLYNSVVFSSINSNEIYALAVPSTFLDTPRDPPQTPPGKEPQLSQTILYEMNRDARAGTLLPTNNADCLGIYRREIISEHSHVILVTKNDGPTPMMSVIYRPTPGIDYFSLTSQPEDWLCGDGWIRHGQNTCIVDKVLQDPDHWTGEAYNASGSNLFFQVDHCLVRNAPSRCTVQFIPEIMGIVILCNIIKIICFMLAVRHPFQPLITLGDALASFMGRPDPHTSDLGPLSAGDVRDAEQRVKVYNIRCRGGIESGSLQELPLRLSPWTALRKRWFSGASSLRWFLTYFLLFAMWIAGWIAFVFSFGGGTTNNFSQQFENGFGAVSPKSTILSTAPMGTLGNVVLANGPQLLLSAVYLSLNGLLTCILLSREFTRYASKRAGLRVSAPGGRYQRSSYWLTLPYTFGIPILAMSGILHWALSQSLFLAKVDVVHADGVFDPALSLNGLGYSSLGFLITVFLGGVVLVTPLGLGWFHYPAGAPTVESNSIAISAACHPLKAEASELLKYGVLRDNRVSLSYERVAPLVAGQRYTTRAELTADALRDISSATITPTRQQKCLVWTLWFLVFAKTVGTVTQIIFEWDFNTLVTGPIVFAYLTTRVVVAVVRHRKKHNLRHFGWQVAPELAFSILHLGLLVGYLQKVLDPKFLRAYSTYYSTVPPLCITTAAFLLSTGIEFWLWWQQQRAQTCAPPIRTEKIMWDQERR